MAAMIMNMIARWCACGVGGEAVADIKRKSWREVSQAMAIGRAKEKRRDRASANTGIGIAFNRLKVTSRRGACKERTLAPGVALR
ncbi:MAG: hypothetical protein ABIO63_12185 [Casimicrobiaceae bacterium]